MNLFKIRDILNATVITNQASLRHKVESAYCADLMSDVLSFSIAKGLLITGLTNAQVIRTAEMAAIDMIVFIQGKRPALETIRLAEEKNIPLLVTDLSMFNTCGRLYEKGLRSQSDSIGQTSIVPCHEA
jgi:predicted transcriptional regulator